MPAHNFTCPTCYFVTSLPPALCPLCGTEMLEVDGEDAGAGNPVDLPWIEAWLATEDPEPDAARTETAAPAGRARPATP